MNPAFLCLVPSLVVNGLVAVTTPDGVLTSGETLAFKCREPSIIHAITHKAKAARKLRQGRKPAP